MTDKKSPAEDKAVTETATLHDNAVVSEGERNYWLMKAEPESRLENGVDVKFSIDNLRAKTEPEPWDGNAATTPSSQFVCLGAVDADVGQVSGHMQPVTTFEP